MKWASIGAMICVLWINALAGSGSLSGKSIGQIANDYPSFFLPANYTFGIWSLIYIGLIGFSLYQLSPYGSRNPRLPGLRILWLLSCLLNSLWIIAFSFEWFGASLVIIAGLFVTLLLFNERSASNPETLRTLDHTFMVYPFTLYLAWISVAVIVNSFQFFTYLELKGLGISGEVWSVVMMAVAAAFGVFMLLYRRAWLFPLVVAWALIGIGKRFDEIELIKYAAFSIAALSVTAALFLSIWQRKLRVPSS